MSLLIEAVEKIAPVLGTAMGGPIGGILTSLLEKTFGLTGDALTAAVSSDPDAAIKLKQIENQHSEILAQYTNEDYLAEISDKANARDMANKSDRHFWILPAISILFIVGFFVFICLMLGKYFSNTQDAHQIFDILSNSTMLILSFWFGSCHGNK